MRFLKRFFRQGTLGDMLYVAAGELLTAVTGTKAAGKGPVLQSDLSVAWIDIATQAELDAVAATLGDLSGAFDPIGSKTVFIATTQGTTPGVPAWDGFSTIPTAEVEAGSEYRRQHYVVGAGQVRINTNLKTVTGTPTIKVKYTVDGFGSVTDLVTFAPTGTGQQLSGWVDMPALAKADIGLTFYLADGADTAALDVYSLEVEFKPALVTAFRDFSDDFSDDFS